MLDNHVYNILLQLTEENKSLWRIKDDYLKDAGNCDECRTFWQKLEKDKESHVDKLAELAKKHLG